MAMRGETWRFWVPVAALALFAAYVGQKLVRSHLSDEIEPPDYYFTREISARRGAIFDTLGQPLVNSVPVWEYRLDPVALTNSASQGLVRRRGEPPRPDKAILLTVADALGLDYKTLVKKAANTRNRYQYLSTSTDPAAHRILADSHLVAGVAIEDRQVRQYVQRRRLSHVLGSVNAEHVGSAGVELRYNRELTGVPGRIRGMKDAHGHELYDRRIVSLDPVPGADIHLTVDLNVQYEAETALKWGVKEYGAGSGWCIVMDAANAGVLAMASLPDYDPACFGTASESAKLNRACGFVYEPGSVMKVITAASCFDAGFVGPQHVYSTARNDDRYFRLPGDGSHKWEPTMTVADAIAHSSNIVIGKLGYDFGPKRLYKYMRAFGFGSRTGIELPGEEVGILPDPNKRMWAKTSWSRAAIGQFVAVTATQLCSAYQAIANDGLRMKPHIVSSIVASDGRELYRHEDVPVCRVISPQAARMTRETMLGVATAHGTARRAAIRGYSVAGKTGTAQKTRPGVKGYVPGLYRATFIGIVPASAPKFVILVTLDFDAKTKFHQGGNSSGPVFKRLAQALLRYYEVPPDRPEEISEFEDDNEFDKIMDSRAQNNADNYDEVE